MPQPKYLWRASIRRVLRPLYLVAQNMQSAAAQATTHPEVAPEDISSLQRIDLWDDQLNQTTVPWPEPQPPPPPPEGP